MEESKKITLENINDEYKRFKKIKNNPSASPEEIKKARNRLYYTLKKYKNYRSNIGKKLPLTEGLLLERPWPDIRKMSNNDCKVEIKELEDKLKNLNGWELDINRPCISDRISKLKGHIGEVETKTLADLQSGETSAFKVNNPEELKESTESEAKYYKLISEFLEKNKDLINILIKKYNIDETEDTWQIDADDNCVCFKFKVSKEKKVPDEIYNDKNNHFISCKEDENSFKYSIAMDMLNGFNLEGFRKSELNLAVRGFFLLETCNGKIYKKKTKKKKVVVKANSTLVLHEKDNLNEAFSISIAESELGRISQMPISKLLKLEVNDIKADIKDKHNGKSVEDYLVPAKDGNLTVSTMRSYIMKYGNKDEKDLLKDKLDALDSFIKKSKGNTKKKKFSLSYGIVNGIYSLFKRVRKTQEKKPLKECTCAGIAAPDCSVNGVIRPVWPTNLYAENEGQMHNVDDDIKKVIKEVNGSSLKEDSYLVYFSKMEKSELLSECTIFDENLQVLDEGKTLNYTKYVVGHINNVKRGYRWLKRYMPELFEDKNKFKISTTIMKHDLSKFSPKSEFKAYKDHFFGTAEEKKKGQGDFQNAWNHHQKMNKHHWQYWVLARGDGQNYALDMPYENIIEMICDWWTFGWKDGDLGNIFKWYNKNKSNMVLSIKTRSTVEDILRKMKPKVQEYIEKKNKNLDESGGDMKNLKNNKNINYKLEFISPINKKLNIITESVLDPIQKTRCQDIFDSNDKIKKSVKKFILETLNEWKKQVNFKFDIISIKLIGSSTGYQYTDTSDVDITIIAKLTKEQRDEIIPILPNGHNIPDTQHPVNYFFVDPNDPFDPKRAENVYDVESDKWEKKSEKEDSVIPQSYILELTKFFMNALDLTFSEYERDLQEYKEYKALNPEVVEITEKEKKEAMDRKIVDLKADLDSLRIGNHVIRGFLHEAYKKDEGPFEIHISLVGSEDDPRKSVNNLVYKMLEKYGYREKLDSTIKFLEEMLTSESSSITENSIVEEPVFTDDGREVFNVKGNSINTKEEYENLKTNGGLVRVEKRAAPGIHKETAVFGGTKTGKLIIGKTPHNTEFKEK